MEERWYCNVHISQQTGLDLIRVRVLHGIMCLNEQYQLHLTCYHVNMRESQLPSSNPRPLQPLPLLLLSRTLTSSTSIIAIKLLLYYVIPAPQARLRCSELQAYTFPCRLPSSWVAVGIVNGALARCSLHTVMGECIRILASTCNPSSSFYSKFMVYNRMLTTQLHFWGFHEKQAQVCHERVPTWMLHTASCAASMAGSGRKPSILFPKL